MNDARKLKTIKSILKNKNIDTDFKPCGQVIGHGKFCGQIKEHLCNNCKIILSLAAAIDLISKVVHRKASDTLPIKTFVGESPRPGHNISQN